MEETLQLWSEWDEKPSIALKHKIFEQYSDWMTLQAKVIYRKFNVTNCELSDYIHYATIALLESIERYNTDKDIPFEVFAIKRLKGEILDNVTKFSEKSSRHAQIRVLENRKFISFINKDKKNSTESIVELTLDLYLIQLLEEHNFFETTLITQTPFHSVEFDHLKRQLLAIIDKLETKQQAVLRYHYFYQWNFVEIAKHFDLTRGRVSQIHKQAIENLKKKHFT